MLEALQDRGCSRKDKKVSKSCAPFCQNDFQIILLEEMWNYVCIAWKLGYANSSIQVYALCVSFLRKVFLTPQMSAWTFRLFVGVGWACIPHLPKFSPESLEVIEFTRFGFDKLAFFYKDFWQKNPMNSRLRRKDLGLRKLILLTINYNFWKPSFHWSGTK